jgi:nitrogen fixation NifU-like protein
MDDLYREVIIEHYKNPSFRGSLEPKDISFADNNPLCGDHIQIDLRVSVDGIVSDARFDGHGCAISQASADLFIESIIGKSLEEVKKLNNESVHDLLVIELGPVRLK